MSEPLESYVKLKTYQFLLVMLALKNNNIKTHVSTLLATCNKKES